MSTLLALLAQLLHIAAVLIAAPLLAGAVADRTFGWGRPLREIRHLLRKETIRTEGASVLTAIAPILSATLAALAAFLIPSFALGMTFAPFTDVLSLAVMMAAGRTVTALAAIDAGTGQGGVAAARTMQWAHLGEPALLLCVVALALLAGDFNLDTILTARLEASVSPSPVAGLAIAALALIGFADQARPSIDAAFSGVDLALMRIAGWLWRVAWCDLVAALALPIGLAPAEAGPLAWGIGLLAWIGKLALAALVLAWVRPPASVRAILALALAVAAIAAILPGGAA